MRLGLSSAAAPGASVAELVDACRARGLSTLEVVIADGIDVYELARRIVAAEDQGVTISGLLSGRSTDAPALAALARVTGAPIVVADACALKDRIERARAISTRDGDVRVLVRGPVEAWLDTVVAEQMRFAWQVDQTSAQPADLSGV